jgi:Immunity protein 52
MMIESFYRYFIRSRWQKFVETPDAIGAKFLETLDALSSINGVFAKWTMTDIRNLSSLPLDKARSQITKLIENNIARGDFDQPLPAYGYRAHARAGQFKDPRSVSFNVDAGGSISNGTELEFAEYDVAPDLAILTYPLLKAALLEINAIWQAPWACAQAFRSGHVKVPIELNGVQATRIESVEQVPLDPTFPDSIFHIPWIAYLSRPLTSGLALPPEIQTENTLDGGLLMTATEERLDPDNPEHVRRARVLAESMIKQTGYSSDYGRPIWNA